MGRKKKSIFSWSSSENTGDGVNVEDSTFVYKTLHKWILINFCFSTWPHCRLPCAVNFQGVGCPRLLHLLGVERVAMARHMGFGSSAELTSALWMLLPSFHRHGMQPFFYLFNQENAWELCCLSCWLVAVVCPGVCMWVYLELLSLPSHCKLHPDQTAVGLGLFHLSLPVPALSWLSCAWDMGLPIRVFSKSGADQEHTKVWSCILTNIHSSGTFLRYIYKSFQQ